MFMWRKGWECSRCSHTREHNWRYHFIAELLRNQADRMCVSAEI